MRYLKTFENYEPEEILVGQVWYGGNYDYEEESRPGLKKHRYYIIITGEDETFQIINYDVLDKNLKVERTDADVLSSFIDRFKFVLNSANNLKLKIKTQKYNL